MRVPNHETSGMGQGFQVGGVGGLPSLSRGVVAREKCTASNRTNFKRNGSSSVVVMSSPVVVVWTTGALLLVVVLLMLVLCFVLPADHIMGR